jgi:hypothetical protein
MGSGSTTTVFGPHVSSPDGGGRPAVFHVAGWDAARSVVKVDLAARRVVAAAPLAVPAIAGETTTPTWSSWFGALLDGARGLLLLRPRTAEAKPVLPAAAVLAPDGTRLYAAGGRAGGPRDVRGAEQRARRDGIWVLDTRNLAVIGRLAPGREFWGEIALSPDGARLYAVDRPTATLSVLDTAAGAELARWRGFATAPQQIERVVRGPGG